MTKTKWEFSITWPYLTSKEVVGFGYTTSLASEMLVYVSLQKLLITEEDAWNEYMHPVGSCTDIN